MIRVHIFKYVFDEYIMIQLLIQHYSSVAACSGFTKGTKVELQYVYCFVYARTGTYYIMRTLEQQIATAVTAVLVLQLLAVSAAVCLTLYQVFSRIDTFVLILLDLNSIQ